MKVVKKKWEDENYRKRVRDGAVKSGTLGWPKSAQINGGKAKAKKELNKNLKLLQEGKYELLSFNFRRQQILKEAEYKCESCKNSEWLGKPIWLEIHHIDDDGTNNKRENLMILCPNCHSTLDPNYRVRSRSNR